MLSCEIIYSIIYLVFPWWTVTLPVIHNQPVRCALFKRSKTDLEKWNVAAWPWKGLVLLQISQRSQTKCKMREISQTKLATPSVWSVLITCWLGCHAPQAAILIHFLRMKFWLKPYEITIYPWKDDCPSRNWVCPPLRSGLRVQMLLFCPAFCFSCLAISFYSSPSEFSPLCCISGQNCSINKFKPDFFLFASFTLGTQRYLSRHDPQHWLCFHGLTLLFFYTFHYLKFNPH